MVAVYVILAIVAAPIMLMPSLVAFQRRHRNTLAITVLNTIVAIHVAIYAGLLLWDPTAAILVAIASSPQWCGAAWAAAMVWACTADVTGPRRAPILDVLASKMTGKPKRARLQNPF